MIRSSGRLAPPAGSLAALARGAHDVPIANHDCVIGKGAASAVGVDMTACIAADAGALVQVVTPENVAQARASFPEPGEPFGDPFAR